ncbi:uncharacterized protein [Apostichopus japonicus]|uniref:uncharacterized protein n=1 Tax=Stichopus japonicus TaxID=307972 RepID=UPI003AB59A0C
MDVKKKNPQTPTKSRHRRKKTGERSLPSSPRGEDKAKPAVLASLSVSAPVTSPIPIPVPDPCRADSPDSDVFGSSVGSSGGSTSSSDFVVCFDDDFEFEIDWEKEKAKRFYNSTKVYPPRISIPEWAEWDFSKNKRMQELAQQNWERGIKEPQDE